MGGENHLYLLTLSYIYEVLDHSTSCNRMEAILNFFYQDQTALGSTLDPGDHSYDGRFTGSKVEL
ncbi:hypothetical protein AW923_13360 [Pseudomonas aeruginosa]|nr:hypothetical protein AN453_18615 [Pseudomonas aeruginosa]KXE04748.1 hypothetical protein AW917_13145 [Pseudomonas aeruginosa]KXE06546.1 hypothetical protein AW918_12610 [Pseudomonas aeruginosa]KXE18826.1 hypothetical protein AW920_12845 [Pseudomonas aeruginosa]KXE20408.1 hypothetical protein AW919_13300 [Pseudomonas aeruginosa]